MSVITRRGFLGASAAFAALAERSVSAEDAPSASEGGIRVLFLGTGAAGWDPKWAEENANARRQSSVLLDGKVLIDFTQCAFDKLPKVCHPEVLFQELLRERPKITIADLVEETRLSRNGVK